MTTTAYHSETNGWVEYFNRTLDTRIRCYVGGEKLKDWATKLNVLTYVYKTQMPASTELMAFELTLSRSPRTSDL